MKAGTLSQAAVIPGEEPAAPRSSKGARTRARLLQAAKETFEEDGFLEARITDIAERANLSHGSFYHYFDSKEQIFREVADAVEEKLAAPLADVIFSPTFADVHPQERLREAMSAYLGIYRSEARFVGLIEQVSRYDPHVNALVLRRHQMYADQVAASISGLQSRGVADQFLNPQIVASAIGALTARFAELWLVQDAVDCAFDDGVDQLARMLANVLGIQPEVPQY